MIKFVNVSCVRIRILVYHTSHDTLTNVKNETSEEARVLLVLHIGLITWNSTIKTTAAMMTAASAALGIY